MSTLHERAAQLLKDETLQQMFVACEADFTRAWKNAPSLDEREAAWVAVRALEAVKRQLQITVTAGIFAAKRESQQ